MYSALRHIGSLAWKRQAIQLTFFVTRKCNTRCPYCFYLNSTKPIPAHLEELSLDEIGRLARSLGSLLWLAFSGGEIFLRKDLVEISKLFYDHNKPVIMLYPTNGLLPERIKEYTEQILRYCRKSVVVVKLSLDGLREKHDALRHTPGGFAKVIQSYQQLAGLLDRYRNLELGINTVFCSENQDHMDEIIDYVHKLHAVKTHTISLVRGELRQERYQQIDPNKYRQAITRLEHELKNKTASIYRFNGSRLKAAQDIVQRRLIQQTMAQNRRLIPCYAGNLNLVLSESGEVYPCEMLNSSFGNIREYDYDIKRVVRSSRAQSVLTSIANKECHCTHECYFITNILFNPRLYPAVLRQYAQL